MKHSPSVSTLVTRRKFLGHAAAGAAAVTFAVRGRAQAEPKKLGWCFVGLGNYATGTLAPAMAMTKHCRVAGVVTGSPEKGKQWSQAFGFPEKSVYGYDTMARIADNPDIDIVYVVTPNALHADQVIAAAKAGKHVVSEKPFSTNVADAERALAACKAAKVKLSIGYRMHFCPYHDELRRLAREQDYGAFTAVKGGFSFIMRQKVWRAEKKWAGGGPLMDLGIYFLQSACMASNGAAPIAVTATEGAKTRPDIFADVEETIDWTMEFANGLRGEGSTSYQKNLNQVRADAPKGYIDIRTAYSYSGQTGGTTKGELWFDNPPGNQQARQMDDFALCVREGRESRVPGEMGVRDLKIIEAIYTSAAQGGKRVEVKA
jgi:glucose-fructose oxidoreductase